MIHISEGGGQVAGILHTLVQVYAVLRHAWLTWMDGYTDAN
jgi:hypothetical protein